MTEETANRSVYLDGHATTPLAPEASEAMSPWWSSFAANANSPHVLGQRAAAAVEKARSQIAQLVDVAPSEIVFTSGATEANNLALLGIAGLFAPNDSERRNIVVSAIEHKSVLAVASELGRRGWEIRIAPVDRNGRLSVEMFAEMVDERTLLASVMAANNEIGTIQPLADVLSICRNSGAMIHVDAAQSVGKIPTSFPDVDFASISSHKMYGPPGVGALFVSSAAPFKPRPLFFGGSQESGLRPGTLPVPLIVGFGAAAASRIASMEKDASRTEKLREHLLEGLRRRQVRFMINGDRTERLPGSLNIRVLNVDAMELIMRLGERVLVAEGSACSSGNIAPSHVLTAIGLSAEEASCSIRMFISRFNTVDDMEVAAEQIALAAGAIRQ
ncbi:cysteine desulfurase family protein [Pseudorhizobium banfieldiae]|nr:cysteine desulfurase family protein [Pseudorhizobium banfieldiae]CAD6600518.1 cysteine desulfurase [arsenite-oxidising bacterium NT-25]